MAGQVVDPKTGRPKTQQQIDEDANTKDTPEQTQASVDAARQNYIDNYNPIATQPVVIDDANTREGVRQGAAQMLSEQEYNGPSVEREGLLHSAGAVDQGKPYYRYSDPAAYAESVAQAQAAGAIQERADTLGQGRVAPQISGPITVDKTPAAGVSGAIRGSSAVVDPITKIKSTKIDGQQDIGSTSYTANKSATTTLAPAAQAAAAGVQHTSIDPVSDALSAGVNSTTYDAAGRQRAGDVASTGANASGVTDTALDRGEDQQVRASQLASIDRNTSIAEGNGPSNVPAVLQQGTNASLAAQAAAIASNRGASSVGGLNSSLRNASALQQAIAAGKASEMKVAEQAAGEDRLTALQGATRAQDIGANTTQAQLTAGAEQQRSAQQQQVALANQEADLRAKLQNQQITAEEFKSEMDAINAQRSSAATATNQALSQASAQQQQIALANQQKNLELALKGASISAAEFSQMSAQEQQTALSNAAAQNDQSLAQGQITEQEHARNQDAINAQRAQKANAANAATSQTAAQDLQRDVTQVNIAADARKSDAQAANERAAQQATLDANRYLADQQANNRINEMKLDRDTQLTLSQLDTDTKLALANLDAQLRQQGMDDAAISDIMKQQAQQANYMMQQGQRYDELMVQEAVQRHNMGKEGQVGALDLMKLAVGGAGAVGSIAGGFNGN
jgi:hypothetical protein